MITTLLGALRLALGAIARNKMRAVLTVLGIFIGVTAVVIVTAASTGATDLDRQRASTAWRPTLSYVSAQPQQASGARVEDDGPAHRGRRTGHRARGGERLRRRAVALRPPGQVVYGDKNWSTTLIGTGLSFFPIRATPSRRARRGPTATRSSRRRSASSGRRCATNLFGTEPIRSVTRSAIGRSPYRVIGYSRRAAPRPFGDDQDDIAHDADRVASARASMHTSPGRTSTSSSSARRAIRRPTRAKAQIERHPSPAPPHRARARTDFDVELAGRAPAGDGRRSWRHGRDPDFGVAGDQPARRRASAS